VKVAFDTSVIVAALVQEHPAHRRAIWWLRSEETLTRIASWHAFAETWAVLTSMPLDPPVSGQVAVTVLERLRPVLTFIAPRANTYRDAASRCSGLGIRSGAIYDAIHLITAEMESADLLLTFNERDFTRLVGSDRPRIVVPPDPPRVP
jgi:predicted nucleic acid-binding protein